MSGNKRTRRRTTGPVRGRSKKDKGSRGIWVVVIDDHPVTRLGIKAALSSEPGMQVAALLPSFSDFEHLPKSSSVDVVITDSHRARELRDALDLIKDLGHRARVIVFSGNERGESVLRAIEAGAYGYISKRQDVALLVDAVRNVAAGIRFVPAELDEAKERARTARDQRSAPERLVAALPERYRTALRLTAEGKTAKQIARLMGDSESAIQTLMKRLRKKLAVTNKAALVRIAVSAGLAEAVEHIT